MSRRLPRSFFWIDQQLIRSGIWNQLSSSARLAYLALVASCDREGVTIWSRSKLMEVAGCKDHDDWLVLILELRQQNLIALLKESSPPAIQVISLSPEPKGEEKILKKGPAPGGVDTAFSSAPIVVHTCIHFGAKATPYVEPSNSD